MCGIHELSSYSFKSTASNRRDRLRCAPTCIDRSEQGAKPNNHPTHVIDRRGGAENRIRPIAASGDVSRCVRRRTAMYCGPMTYMVSACSCLVYTNKGQLRMGLLDCVYSVYTACVDVSVTLQ